MMVGAALIVSSCGAKQASSGTDGKSVVRIDHVIVGTNDLEAGIAEIERLTGVRPVVGGEHPGRGTRNALISLGAGTYLELLAPNPKEDVASSDVAELRALKRLKPLGWAAGTDDPAAVRSALGSKDFDLSPQESGSRRRPDGSVIEWETFSYEEFEHPFAPFFIHWKRPDLHPSKTSPTGCRLTAMRFFDPRPETLAAALLPLKMSASVEKADQREMELELACPKGMLRLR